MPNPVAGAEATTPTPAGAGSEPTIGPGEAPTEAAVPSASIRADLGRALADGLARAMAAGDMRAARIALTALTAPVDDAPEQSGAPVVELAAERRNRGER